MDIKIKDSFKNTWKSIVRLYIIIVTLLCIAWSPFFKYQNDNDGLIVTIDILDYHKTILITN